MARILMVAAGLNGLAAVAMGAAVQHLLAGDPGRLELAATGSRYGLPHAALLLALAALPIPAGLPARRLLTLTAASLALGVTLFAFSLYALALGAPAAIAALTPIGGTLMILGWALLLAYAVIARAGL